MFRYLLPLFLVLVVMIGCSVKKADTDYDPSFATEALKTFSVVHKSQDGLNTLNEERIREAIAHELELKGYEAAAEDAADFHVTFQVRVEEDVPSNVSFGFGFGSSSGGMGTAVGATHNATNDKETLIINAIDPKTQKMFWRTSISKNSREFKSPQARTDYFNKTIASMLKDFPVRPAGNR